VPYSPTLKILGNGTTLPAQKLPQGCAFSEKRHTRERLIKGRWSKNKKAQGVAIHKKIKEDRQIQESGANANALCIFQCMEEC
jgi:hypothetical protein